ncbi:hypothetical protein GGI00_004663, partial [Coemansia sp. RSA 2681]
PLRPAARASQARASLADQRATITIPYVAPTKRLSSDGHDTSPNDVLQLLADADKLQHRHRLLLSRLMERLSATGWDIHYAHINVPTEGIEIALPPSSGIRTVAELDALLCDWGLDTSHFAAALRGPRAPPPATTRPAAPDVQRSASASLDRDSDGSWDSEAMGSDIFSLIVNEVVDPEEAYREDVRDFLSQLEQMPRLQSI